MRASSPIAQAVGFGDRPTLSAAVEAGAESRH
jgi:hypothetical protein